MITRTLKEMENEFVEFARKHDNDFKVVTSPMVDNYYRKNYYFADGSEWIECNDIVIENVEAEIHGIKVVASVKMTRCEYWNTDDSRSKYVYGLLR